MRTASTLAAAIFACGWLTIAAFAFAQQQESQFPAPPTTVAESLSLPAGPMILQLGPPPAYYSPSADFKSHIAAIALDDCASGQPIVPMCAPPQCPPNAAALPPSGPTLATVP